MKQMDVIEVWEDTTRYTYDVKVVWAIGEWGDASFIWGNKGIYFDKQLKGSTIQQRKQIKKIIDKYHASNKSRVYNMKIKHHGLYSNEWGEIFYISIYMDIEILIWITRMDGKYPCYFFKTVNTKL